LPRLAAGRSLNIEARFPHRGRIELQGTIGPSGGGTDVIIGGTGVFTTARGASRNFVAVSSKELQLWDDPAFLFFHA